jgi:hypothetical protein
VSNDYLKSFYELGYTHTELEELLSKISNGELLTKEQYDLLMNTVDIIKGITTFNGTYESLPDKPDIVDVIRQSNEFVSFNSFDARARTIQVSLELMLKEVISELRFDLEQNKADINHLHDDRYSLYNHDHEGLYFPYSESGKLVTKENITEVLENLEIKPGMGGGGGGDCAYVGIEEPVNDNVIWFVDTNRSASSEITYDNPVIAELFSCIQMMQKQINDLQAEVEYLKLHGGGGGSLPDVPDDPDIGGDDEEDIFVYFALEDGGLFELEEGGFLILEEERVVIKESTLALEDGMRFLLEDGGFILLEEDSDDDDIIVAKDNILLLESGGELLLENNSNILLEN